MLWAILQILAQHLQICDRVFLDSEPLPECWHLAYGISNSRTDAVQLQRYPLYCWIVKQEFLDAVYHWLQSKEVIQIESDFHTMQKDASSWEELCYLGWVLETCHLPRMIDIRKCFWSWDEPLQTDIPEANRVSCWNCRKYPRLTGIPLRSLLPVHCGYYS